MVHGCSGNSLLHQVKVNSLCVLTGAGCSVPEAGCHRDCVWGVRGVRREHQGSV